jgi:hypothetical protein
MLSRRVWIVALVLIIAAGAAVAAPPKDAIVIGLLAEPVTMDPPQITDLNSARVTKRIFVHRKRVQGFKLHPNFDLVLTQVSLQ